MGTLRGKKQLKGKTKSFFFFSSTESCVFQEACQVALSVLANVKSWSVVSFKLEMHYF